MVEELLQRWEHLHLQCVSQHGVLGLIDAVSHPSDLLLLLPFLEPDNVDPVDEHLIAIALVVQQKSRRLGLKAVVERHTHFLAVGSLQPRVEDNFAFGTTEGDQDKSLGAGQKVDLGVVDGRRHGLLEVQLRCVHQNNTISLQRRFQSERPPERKGCLRNNRPEWDKQCQLL